jgi:hypothetical protein
LKRTDIVLAFPFECSKMANSRKEEDMKNKGNKRTLLALVRTGASAAAWAQSSPLLTTLYSFSGSDGKNPYNNVTVGTGGLLYGTTVYGGTLQNGVVSR